MSRIPRKFLFDISIIFFVILTGTLGYITIEGWSFFDSLYMTVITLTTIGFGEIHPLSSNGRVFTIFLILGGIGAITYTLGSISSYFFGERVYNLMKQKNMTDKIKQLKNHYIICGASEIGLAVIDELVLAKLPVLLIDRDNERLVRAMQKYGCLILCGDATDDDVLTQAHIEKANGLVAAFGNDHENVYLIMSARQLAPTLTVYAKVKEEDATKKLLLAGANHIINPYQIGGLRLASLIVRPDVVKLMDEFVKDPRKLRIEELIISKTHELFEKSWSIETVEKRLKLRVIAYKKAGELTFQYLFTHNPITFGEGDLLFYLSAKEK